MPTKHTAVLKFAKETKVTLQSRGGGPPTIVEKKEADFPLLADPTKETATKYGVLMPNPPGFANRWTFYIDKQGKIRLIMVGYDDVNEASLSKLIESLLKEK